MNARQKAKFYKKKLQELYEDYVASATAMENVLDLAGKQIQLMRDQQATCVEKFVSDKPCEIDYLIASDLMKEFMDNDTFKRAVVFEGHTDPDTGKYTLEAKLTVVMPELSEPGEDGFENEVENFDEEEE